MTLTVTQVIADTKGAMKNANPTVDVEAIDFSYITPELIDFYQQHSNPKDPKSSRDGEKDGPTDADYWYYYGNALSFYSGSWHWRNSNPLAGHDGPQHICGTQYGWMIGNMGFQVLAATTCNPQQPSPFRGN